MTTPFSNTLNGGGKTDVGLFFMLHASDAPNAFLLDFPDDPSADSYEKTLSECIIAKTASYFNGFLIFIFQHII